MTTIRRCNIIVMVAQITCMQSLYAQFGPLVGLASVGFLTAMDIAIHVAALRIVEAIKESKQ